MSKKINKFLCFTGLTFISMHIANKILHYTATLKNLTEPTDDHFFDFRYGKIHYKKSGSGPPLIFIHDLDPISSTFEWSKIIKSYEDKYTVYTLDLLGCGHSEKPNLVYTNYLYVQLLSDFIKEVVKESPTVIATGLSSSFCIMCANMHKDQIKQLILVNPTPLLDLTASPNAISKSKKYIMTVPIIGTFIYNMLVHESRINSTFETKYYFKPSLVSTKLEDIYFESAHIGKGSGRYLQASLYGNYLNINITNALKELSNIYIIGSRNMEQNISNINQYTMHNSDIETAYLSNCAKLPQLESPKKFTEILNMFLDI